MDVTGHDHPQLGSLSRVLFLSHDMLWPSVGGGRIRCITLLLRALEVVRIDLIVVAPEADVVRDRWASPDLPGLTTHVFVDRSNSPIVPARVSPDANDLARRMSQEHGGYDAVHIEGHYLWPVVPIELTSRTVVVEQNIESTLLGQRLALGDPVTTADIDRLRAGEEHVWRRAGAMITLSPDDAAEIRRRQPDVVPHLVPNGWDHLPARSVPRPDHSGPLVSPRLLFFADYDYAPNRDAFRWLITDVFPRIRSEVPGAELILGGINMSEDLEYAVHGCPGARVRGYIDDLAAELDRADIVLCPLRWGGGVKVKVVEAIRRACLLVSTTTGGIEYIPESLRSAVCFADDAGSFAKQVVRVCADSEERHWRRAQLVAHQHEAPAWEESSERTMRIWADVSNREDQRPHGDG
jgi:glycosyltransferase involved in cell wall biosynthesis